MPKADGKGELLFLPLGGSGEIGMNLNLYGYAGKWLMLDCGVTFGDDRAPGVDVLMPDPSFIVERRENQELAGARSRGLVAPRWVTLNGGAGPCTRLTGRRALG